MNFEIVEHQYENTGGHCMVGFDEIWLPDEHRTLFAVTNEEGCNLLPVNGYYAIDNCIEPLFLFETERSYAEEPEYFEIAKECVRLYARDDHGLRLPYGWLTDSVKATVPAEYTAWLQEEYDDPDPLYETDGKKVIFEDAYVDMLAERARQERAGELRAVDEKRKYFEAVACFQNFKKAYAELVDVWTRNRDLINDILVDDYPFDESFDELRIPQWCDEIAYELVRLSL